MLQRRPTENLAAYDPYLRGLDHYERGQIGQNWESQLLAVELFDSAATLDPSFAMAHIMLANAHLLLGGSGYDETLQPQMFGAPRMALVKAALDDAEELDPDLAEFHAAMRHYYGRLGESERAEEHLVAVLRRKPNDPDALLSLAGFQIQRGELDSAEASLEKAGELDPRSAATAGSIRSRYATLGRYEDALPYAERAISLAATEPAPYTAKAWLHILAGDTSAALQTLRQAEERVGMANLLVNLAREGGYVTVFRCFGEYATAMHGLPLDAFGTDTIDYLFAKAYSFHANPDLARAYFDSIAVFTSAALQANPDWDMMRALLLLAHAAWGRKDAAMQEAEALLRSLGGRPGLYGRRWIAEAYVKIGEYDAAIEQLRISLTRPHRLSPALLRIDPIWDPLREHPGFQELVAGSERHD